MDEMLAQFAGFAYMNVSELSAKDINTGEYTYHLDQFGISYEFHNWEIVTNYTNGDKFGFYLFKKGNEYVFAIRGTRPPNVNTLQDWWQTLGYSLFNDPQNAAHAQMPSLKKYLKETLYPLLSDKNNTIYITGHSLGGLLAMESYWLTYKDNPNINADLNSVVTFNALGVSDNTAIEIRKYLDTNERIRNYYTCCDIAKWICTGRFQYPGISKDISIHEPSKHANRSFMPFDFKYHFSETVREALFIRLGAHTVIRAK